jgi:hypothetical protein
MAATNKFQPEGTSAEMICQSETLPTGYGDASVQGEVIDWHAKIAKGRRRCEVIDKATLTTVDLETDECQDKAENQQKSTDDSTTPVFNHTSANRL